MEVIGREEIRRNENGDEGNWKIERINWNNLDGNIVGAGNKYRLKGDEKIKRPS